MGDRADDTAGDGRTGYRPDVPLAVAPLFERPPRLLGALRFFAWKQFWPGGATWIAAAWLAWRYLTPELASMATFRTGWIAAIWLRNAVLLSLLAGGLHGSLYRRRAQGHESKFTDRWPGDGARFTFGNQTLDNVFWSVASGVTVSTLFEVVGWWLLANGHTPMRTFAEDWAYLSVLCLGVFAWGNVHFYLTHRLLHVRGLYEVAHSLHHRNLNTGPWSGLAMHPIEHLLYLSGPVLLWVVPGHPVLHLTLLFFRMLAPALTHAGFERVQIGGRASFLAGDYFHHLHHRYFECNYGNTLVPLDKPFGTLHDGTPEAHVAMQARRRASGR